MSGKPQPDFTLDEVAREMARRGLELWESIKNQEPTDKGDEGLTSDEYAQLWGIPQNTAKKRLKQMTEQGLMVMGKAYRQWKAGHWQRKHVYRPRDKEGKDAQ